MKKFFSEFKQFITRGNILDMAIGVIIGGAFNAIVTAFTNQIIMPLINALLSVISGGKDGLAGAVTVLKWAEDGTLENSIYINWGAFISAVLNFLIIAMTLFIILKVAMKSSQLLKDATNVLKKDISRLSKHDRKVLKKQGIEIEKLEEKYKEGKIEDLLKAEQTPVEPPKPVISHQEQLLIEIRDLLAAKANPELEQKVEAVKALEEGKAD